MDAAMEQMLVEVFVCRARVGRQTQEAVLMTRDVFSALVLPCFVRCGDYAEGRLLNVAL
jgi:hypothetical protein